MPLPSGCARVGRGTGQIQGHGLSARLLGPAWIIHSDGFTPIN